MFGSTVLPLILGLIFVYFVFSMICSKVNEFVAAKLSWRAKNLEDWLKKTLNPASDTATTTITADRFKRSSLIEAITPANAKHGLPSYISPGTFSLAILDLLMPGDGQVSTVDEVKTAVKSLPDGHPAKAPLLRLAIEAGDSLTAFRTGVEGWFNDAMGRISGWYKRRVQFWLIIYAVGVTALLNVDTVVIARTLWNQDAVRSAVVAQATSQANTSSGTDEKAQGKELDDMSKRVAEVKKLNLPIGWPSGSWPKDGRAWLPKGLGLLLTVVALSLGAPFWFDLLNKVAKLRASGDKPSTG